MSSRTDIDKVVDAVLLTYLMQQCAPIFGRTKIQKSTFLVELRLKENGLVGPHFKFIRYNNGPFSQQVWDTYDHLVSGGFLGRWSFGVTQRGRFLVELVVPEIRRLNEAVLNVMDAELQRCKRKTGESLMKHVYKLQIAPDEEPNKRMRVEDIPMGWTIIDPPPGGLNITPDLKALIQDELSRSEADIERARRKYPETERLALDDLARALSASAQS